MTVVHTQVGTVRSMDDDLNLPPFRLAHSSDWHLGYEAFRAVSPAGNNQRGEDLVRAVMNVCRDIVDYDPPLVVLPGDLTDTPLVPIRYMMAVRAHLQQLASVRPDGTRRQVIVSSGNHEQPRNLKEACFLELFGGQPGVHVVTTRYAQIEFPDEGVSQGRDDVLADVVVHVLPHDQLKRVEWDEVVPVANKANLLMAHGVAGGSELYVRSLGREFAIPTDVLNRAWDYGALGHWHKRTPVSGNHWYCGSPENVSFRDLRDNGDRRGYLQVTVNPGGSADVDTVDLPIRRMFRMPEIDATGMDAEELTEALLEQVKQSDLTGAVVWQVVTSVSADRWGLVDVGAVRRAAGDALHYEVTPRYSGAPSDRRASRTEGDGSQLTDVGELLETRGGELLGDEAEEAIGLARTLVAAELQATGGTAGGGSSDTADNTAKTNEAAADDAADSGKSGGDAGPEPDSEPDRDVESSPPDDDEPSMAEALAEAAGEEDAA